MKRATLVCILSLLAAPAFAAEPVRVATLLPFVEDALRLDPEHVAIVASVRRSLHAPAPEGVVDLGNPHSPSFEGLAEAKPDLVVGDAQLHAAHWERLAATGAEVLLLDTRTVDSTLAALHDVAGRVGAGAAVDAAIADTRGEIEALRLARPVSLLALFGAPGSFYVMTSRAWLGDLATRLGFENVAPAGGSERLPGLVPVNDEAMALLRPEIVVIVAHGDPGRIRSELDRRVANGGAWSGLAQSAGAIHVLDPGLFSANPGLELARAARKLVGLVPSTRAARD